MHDSLKLAKVLVLSCLSKNGDSLLFSPLQFLGLRPLVRRKRLSVPIFPLSDEALFNRVFGQFSGASHA